MGGAAAAAGAFVADKYLLKHDAPPEKIIESEEDPLAFLKVEREPKRYAMGQLKGKRFGGLLTKYTGIDGKVPAEAGIGFRFQLSLLIGVKM